MNPIPLFHIGDFLLVSIPEDLSDSMVTRLQDGLSRKVIKLQIKGVLLDLSSVTIVDSFIGRMLGNMASITAMLGAEAIIVGIQPAVAITMIELGLVLNNIKTALNVDQGVIMLQILAADKAIDYVSKQ